MAKPGGLYEEDFVRWTEEQSTALRRAKGSTSAVQGGSNQPLDWDNLAEEIESLGKSDWRELRSQITRILRHLLKLEVSPAMEPQGGLAGERQRSPDRNRGLLEDSPSLRRDCEGLIKKQIAAAARLAMDDLKQHGGVAEAIAARLKQTEYTAEQVLGDWFPEEPV
jgi:hypothetical protein